MEEKKIILPTEEDIHSYNLKFENIGDIEGLTDIDKATLKSFDEITNKFRKELIEQMRNKNKVAKVEETKLNE